MKNQSPLVVLLNKASLVRTKSIFDLLNEAPERIMQAVWVPLRLSVGDSSK